MSGRFVQVSVRINPSAVVYSTLYSTVKYYRILGGLLFKSLRIFNNDDTDAKRLIVECY